MPGLRPWWPPRPHAGVVCEDEGLSHGLRPHLRVRLAGTAPRRGVIAALVAVPENSCAASNSVQTETETETGQSTPVGTNSILTGFAVHYSMASANRLNSIGKSPPPRPGSTRWGCSKGNMNMKLSEKKREKLRHLSSSSALLTAGLQLVP